jgi:hypothetical protein
VEFCFYSTEQNEIFEISSIRIKAPICFKEHLFGAKVENFFNTAKKMFGKGYLMVNYAIAPA